MLWWLASSKRRVSNSKSLCLRRSRSRKRKRWPSRRKERNLLHQASLLERNLMLKKMKILATLSWLIWWTIRENVLDPKLPTLKRSPTLKWSKRSTITVASIRMSIKTSCMMWSRLKLWWIWPTISCISPSSLFLPQVTTRRVHQISIISLKCPSKVTWLLEQTRLTLCNWTVTLLQTLTLIRSLWYVTR